MTLDPGPRGVVNFWPPKAAEIFFTPPGEWGAIFWQNHPSVYIINLPTKKLFDTPVPGPPQNFFGCRRQPKIFFGNTQCVHTPLDPRPVPTYVMNLDLSICKKKKDVTHLLIWPYFFLLKVALFLGLTALFFKARRM